MNKFCVLIPVYNHHLKINQIVQTLKQFKLNCFLIDDGSSKQCKQILESIAHQDNSVTLHRFDKNRGKGVAVCKGLEIASSKGYTHAIQIDSDGQHRVEELDGFMELSKKFPSAVISGARSYEDLPASRRYGRLITDFWVCVNTLSTGIFDSMCGYRVYPLGKTMDVIESYPIGKRMDFDTDILVKLYWEGASILHLPISVTYDQSITSHFKLLSDNVRISWMHTCLFFGMIRRFPRLIYRRSFKQEHTFNKAR